ncbi:MAG TPA: biotin--[acetyl-CoA-carboxylase] ligase [Saprospiraceae bacterium]|nr:biotin--[acetyl-CoA-carboxylase] ligase [Saprospiraceae bacterium]
MNSFQNNYIGKPHYYFDNIDSTNDYALYWVSNSSPIEGTAISAGYQTEGRGQIGRNWEGERDSNIYTSIILKPAFLKIQDLFLLNQAISLGISAAIEELLRDPVMIKWPNDILVKNKKKICGILIQNILEGLTLQISIVGIGININQSQFPPHLTNATSLYLEKGKLFHLDTCRNTLFSCIEYYYNLLKKGQFDIIRNNYKDSLFGLEKKHRFISKENEWEAVIKGVQDNGKLILSTPSGVEYFSHHEIKLLLD